MVEILLLLKLPPEVIATAYRFLNFFKSGNLLAREISQSCLNLFNFITSYYTNPSSSQEPLQSNSSKRRGRSAGPKASPEFPFWIVEGKPKLRADQA